MDVVSTLDVEEDLKPEDQFIMCRICVEPICEGVPHHLHQEMYKGLLLGQIYRAVTNIMLHDDGGIPGDICDSCFEKLIDCYKFIEECIKANKIFLSLRRQFVLCNRATNNLKDLSSLHCEVNIKHDEKKEERSESIGSQNVNQAILRKAEEISHSKIFPECVGNPSSLIVNDEHYENLSKFSNGSSETTQVKTTENMFNKSGSSTTSSYSSLPMKSKWIAQQNVSQHCELKQSVVVQQNIHFGTRFSKSYRNIRKDYNSSEVVMVKDNESVEGDGTINQFQIGNQTLEEENLNNEVINQLDKEIDPQNNEGANTKIINQIENEVERESEGIDGRTNTAEDFNIKIKEFNSQDNNDAKISANNSNKEIKENNHFNVLIDDSSKIKNNSNDLISLIIEDNAEKTELDNSFENNLQSQVTPVLTDTSKAKEQCINSNLLKQITNPIIKEILQENHNMKSLSNKTGYLIIKRTDSKAKDVSCSDRTIKNRYSLENEEKGKLIHNDKEGDVIQSKITNDYSKNSCGSSNKSSSQTIYSDKKLNKAEEEIENVEESVTLKNDPGIITEELKRSEIYGESSGKKQINSCSDGNKTKTNYKIICKCKKKRKLSETSKGKASSSCICRSAVTICKSDIEKYGFIQTYQIEQEKTHTPLVPKKDKIIIHSNISIKQKDKKEDVAGINRTDITTEITNDKQNESVMKLKRKNIVQNHISKSECDTNKLLNANNFESNEQFEALNTNNSLTEIDKEIDNFYEELPQDITSFSQKTEQNIDLKSSKMIINVDEITLNLSSKLGASNNSKHLLIQNESNQLENNTSLQNQIISVEEYECGIKIGECLNETTSLNVDNSQYKSPIGKSYNSKYSKFWKSELTRKNKVQSNKQLNKIFITSDCDNSSNNFDGEINNISQSKECERQNLITIDENSAPILDQVNVILQKQNTSQIKSQDLENVSSTTINQLPNTTLVTSTATEIEHKECNTENDVKLEFVDDKEDILIDFDYDNSEGILNLNGNQDETKFLDNLEPISKESDMFATNSKKDENCCMNESNNVNNCQSLNQNYLPLEVENENINEVKLIGGKTKNVVATDDFIPLIDITEEKNCNFQKIHTPPKTKEKEHRKSLKKRKAKSQRKEHAPLFVIDKEPQRVQLNEEFDNVQKKKRKLWHKQTKNKVVTNYEENRLDDQNLEQQDCLANISTKVTSPNLSNHENEPILIEDDESDPSDKSESNLSINELNDEPYSCQCCDKNNKHTPAIISCKICADTFFTVSALKRHLFLKHREPNFYKCAWCAKEYVQWLCLEQHVTREHRGAKKCASCKLFFKKKSQMKLHNKMFHK